MGSLAPGAKEPRQGVWVCAFGKHPGERDHFEYMPEGSRRLLSIWSFLYDAGLKSLVPTWRQWLPAERLEAFDHVILWRTSERVVAGRMWSSSDGAQPPRKDFPIVVCAECRGLSINWTVNEVLPYLEKMGTRFRETDSIKVVKSVVDSAREELARKAQSPAALEADPPPNRQVLDRLAAEPCMGEDGEGFWRILYFLSGDLPVAQGQRAAPQRTLQMRVPACAPSPGEACRLWTDLVLNFTDSKTSILCVAAVGQDWVDVIIGPPEPSQLACIRSNTTRLPLTTSIPYEIDDELIAQFKSLMTGTVAPRTVVLPVEKPPEPIPPPRPAAAAPLPPAPPAPPAAPPQRTAVFLNVPKPAPPAPERSAPEPQPEPEPEPQAAQISTGLPPHTPPAHAPEIGDIEPPQSRGGKSGHRALILFIVLGVVGLVLGTLYILGKQAQREQARRDQALQTPTANPNANRGASPGAVAKNPATQPAKTEPTRVDPVIEKPVVPDADPRTNWPAEQKFTAARDAAASLEKEFGAAAAAPLKTALETFTDRLARVRNRMWNDENKPVIERELAELATDAARLNDQAAAALKERRDHTAWVRELRARQSITSTPALNAEWVRRRDELLKQDTLAPQRRQVFDTLEKLLVSVDRAVVLDPAPAAPVEAWQPALSEALAAQRAQALAGVLAAITDRDGAPALPADAVAAASKSLQAYSADLIAFLTDHARIEQLLAQGWLPDEAPAQGEKTIRQCYTQWAEKSPASPALAQSVDATRQRVAGLLQIAELKDPTRLSTLLNPADPAVTLIAWRRLHALAAPGPLKQWKDWESLALAAIKQIASEQRRAALATEIQTATRNRWNFAIARASSDEAIDEALAHAAAFEIDPAKIEDPRIRFNLLLRSFRRDFAAASEDSAANRAAATFLDGARSLKLAQPVDLDALDKAIRQSADLSRTASPGPGAEKGWEKQATNNGFRFIIPTRDGRQQVLDFVRVEPREGNVRPFYLLTTEVSLRTFIDAVNAKGNWTTAASLLGSQEDAPRGPQGWTSRTDGRQQIIGLERSLIWIDTRGFRPDATQPNAAYEAPDLRNSVQAPDYDHPIQQIPVPAALYVANLLHCRLPTSGEWLAAHAAFSAAPQPRQWNLRDRTWQRQHAYILERIKKDLVKYPDHGIFGPRDQFRSDSAALVWASSLKSPQAAPADEVYDDGVLWFRSVNLPAEETLRNLVGNIAELTCDDPTLADKLAAGPWARIDDAIRGIEFAVIGGSALSAPELGFDKRIPMRPRDVKARFCDVGFRLAFDAPPTPPVPCSSSTWTPCNTCAVPRPDCLLEPSAASGRLQRLTRQKCRPHAVLS